MDRDSFDDFETEKFYFGRTSHPHCKTCVCPEERTCCRTTTTRYYRSPPRNKDTRRSLEDITAGDSEDEEQRRLLTREMRKFALMEKWFERFDFNKDDLLELYELRSLFKFLGVLPSEEYCQCLLESADRDGDGRLSFSEFLLMWRIAQHDDELFEIVKEYSLFSDVEYEYIRKRNPVVEVERQSRRCVGRRRSLEDVRVIRKSPRCVQFETRKTRTVKSRERCHRWEC